MTLPAIGDGYQDGDGNTGEQLNVGRSTQAVRVGGSSSGTLSFFGGTATTRPATISSVTTTAATTSTPWGYSTSTQADAIVTALNSVIADLKALGLIASS